TGQQRYATEIATRLLSQSGVRERPIDEWSQKSPIRAWAKAQLAGVGRTRHERLLTLTSRGPVVGNHHVVVVHDLFVLDNPEWFSRKYVATHGPILRAQLMSAELIVVVSEPVGRRVRSLVRPGTPVVVVPNAPSELFQPDLPDPQALAKHGLRRGGYVLAVSSQEPRKNLARLAAAHAMLPEHVRHDFPLVLAGGSSAIYAQGTFQEDDAIRLGYVDEDELARLYSAAAIVAVPSLNEGFGLPAVEAIASGVEVLVADIPVLHWVCGRDAHYANPRAAESLAEVMAAALAAPVEAEELRRRAIAVRERFSWDASAATLYKAIATLDAQG
ncbi:MAG: glycosyltransferase family 1 protein, partial [Glaciihabitans sp.]|nr:glycosyltransferase family 1 protein [Glaciihabitans sp.]